MADGYLNKCKTCAKRDVAERVAEKMKDPEWAEKEMERHRLKQQRRRAEGRDIPLTPEKKREVALRHAAKYPEKHSARIAFGHALKAGKVRKQPCEQCGSTDSEAHHEDYSKPFDVMWLCPKHHAALHVTKRRTKLRATP